MSPLARIAPTTMATEIAYVQSSTWFGMRLWRSIRAAWRCARLARSGGA